MMVMVEVAETIEDGASDGAGGGGGDECYLVATMVVAVAKTILVVEGDCLIDECSGGRG